MRNTDRRWPSQDTTPGYGDARTGLVCRARQQALPVTCSRLSSFLARGSNVKSGSHTCVCLRPSSCELLKRENTLTRWRHIRDGPGTPFHYGKGLAVFARSNARSIYEKQLFIT